jgi:hypothetical protein
MRLATKCHRPRVHSDAEIKATVGEDIRFADRRRRGSREAARTGSRHTDDRVSSDSLIAIENQPPIVGLSELNQFG